MKRIIDCMRSSIKCQEETRDAFIDMDAKMSKNVNEWIKMFVIDILIKKDLYSRLDQEEISFSNLNPETLRMNIYNLRSATDEPIQAEVLLINIPSGVSLQVNTLNDGEMKYFASLDLSDTQRFKDDIEVSKIMGYWDGIIEGMIEFI